MRSKLLLIKMLEKSMIMTNVPKIRLQVPQVHIMLFLIRVSYNVLVCTVTNYRDKCVVCFQCILSGHMA